MEQVTFADLDGMVGIGKFKYAIVICKIKCLSKYVIPLIFLQSTVAPMPLRQVILLNSTRIHMSPVTATPPGSMGEGPAGAGVNGAFAGGN